jgi:hypothetical protein
MQLALERIAFSFCPSPPLHFILYTNGIHYVCMRMQDPNTIFYVMPFHVAMHDAAAVARDRIAEMAYA